MESGWIEPKFVKSERVDRDHVELECENSTVINSSAMYPTRLDGDAGDSASRSITMAGLSMLVALLGLTLHPAACAQTFPSRPIRLVVGDAPGGSPDTLGRLLGQKVSEQLGQSVVVDNKPGAAGILAAETVVKASADGYTLLLNTTSLWAILPNVKKSLPYDPVKSFAPIMQLATAANVMVINKDHPAKTLGEVVAWGKANPGKLNFASAGIASPAHLAGEMLALYADIKMTHLPYKGAAPALLDVIAGHADFIITSPIAAGPHITNGKVRVLGTTGARRNPTLPDVPPIGETIPKYDISQSWGLSAPAGTPQPVLDILHAAFDKAIQSADVQQKIRATGAAPVGGSADAFAAFMVEERKRLGEVVSKAGIPLSD